MDTISLVTELISNAQEVGASDIHVDPRISAVSIRMRIDGVVREYRSLPNEWHGALIAHLKIVASLRTDEHFAPQDGRFTFTASGHAPIDIRISIMPTYYGENAVLRLFPLNDEISGLAALGMRREQVRAIAAALGRPNGLMLVVGPTGSGKTMTLYALMEMLRTMDDRSRMLVSIEDPIERPLAGIRQIPAGIRSGVPFAEGLRAILRQDPDIIMVGELRDAETARLAVEAALTGHLVLSTLHSRSISTVIPRLTSLGVDPYILASTLRVVMAERLIRTTCDACGVPRPFTAWQRESLSRLSGGQIPVPEVHCIGTKCASCNETGYRGRTGLFDIATVETDPSTDIHAAFERPSRLLHEGIRKIAEGSTTYDEVIHIDYA